MIRLSRPALVHVALGALAVILVVKSAYLQLWKGGQISQIATRQQFRMVKVPAPRGTILDASGKPLVESIEQLTLGVEPGEVWPKDRTKLAKALSSLGVEASKVRAVRTGRKGWLNISRRYMPSELDEIRGMRGVYVSPVMLRDSKATPGALALIGSVDPDGKARGGLELAMDDALSGTPGTVKMTVDHAGRREREVPVGDIEGRVQGHSIRLTLDASLQGIAEGALRDAVVSLNARGGDIVITNPHTGEIAAMASYGAQQGFSTSAMVSEPYEPGSSVKPLVTARLLELGRARAGDTMNIERELVIPGRRSPMTDDHWEPQRTLHDVIKFSSNIGMVKFADRLSSQELYETYRDFGLGMPTGVELPGESQGRIPAPSDWSLASKSSMSIGYAMSVTTLQLAMAFGSIANGGELLEPTLVQEIRGADGDVVFRKGRRVVRRVMSPKVASQMRDMLRAVVQGGTATAANLAIGSLAGKTGTARRVAATGGYEAGAYTATFAGMFPADKPQFVIVVRLDDPEGMYGGATAAPVTRAVLQAALSAQSGILRGSAVAARDENADDDVEDQLAGLDAAAKRAQRGRTVVIPLRKALNEMERATTERPVPGVRNLPVRAAVFALHQAGFKVRLSGSGQGNGRLAQDTSPPAGSLRRPGDLIVLQTRP